MIFNSPLVCNYYVTLRCNDSCEFCEIWQKENYKQTAETPLNDIISNLKDLRKLGIKYIDFTGGEPLLRADIPQILNASKKEGHYNVLTTNGILFQDRMYEIAPFVDSIIFSLDSPEENEHDRIRGTACYEYVINSIKLAKKRIKNVIVNFTVTRDSVLFLPEMVDLAESLGVLLWVNPVFRYGGAEGFTNESLDYIARYRNRKNVAFNFASLDLIKRGGNSTINPVCRAVQSVVTILPDNSMVLPCFYKQDFSAKISRKLDVLYKSKSRDYLVKQGRYRECDKCLAWPYLNPSFLYKFDKHLAQALFSIGTLLLKSNKLRKERMI